MSPIVKMLARLNEALPVEAASDLAWLGDRERCELDAFRDAGRRQQWLAGRRLAKQLIAAHAGCPQLSRIQILSRDERGLGVRPRVFVESQEWPWSLSIAHSDRSVAVAIADMRRGVVGIDIVAASLPVDDGFCHLWFTPRERQWADRDRAKRCADLWAIKEAVYKAAGDGRSWTPREIEIIPQGTSGFEVTLRGRRLGGLQIELGAHDDQVIAIAFVPRAHAAPQAVQERPGQTKQVASSARSHLRAARFVNCAVRGSRVR